MAKHLKAIKCPTCGSPQQTQIQPDTYRCASCGTEYFLDSDDITIHVRQGPGAAPGWSAVPPAELKRRGRWALAG